MKLTPRWCQSPIIRNIDVLATQKGERETKLSDLDIVTSSNKLYMPHGCSRDQAKRQVKWELKFLREPLLVK